MDNETLDERFSKFQNAFMDGATYAVLLELIEDLHEATDEEREFLKRIVTEECLNRAAGESKKDN